MSLCKTRLLFIFSSAMIFTLLSKNGCLAAVAPPNNDYGGIYVVINEQVTQQNNSEVYDTNVAALANPYVDGATIIVKWSLLYNHVDPGPQNYNWQALDNWLDLAVAFKKKISLGVVAGMYTPTWLLGAPYSVAANDFTFNSGPVQNADCVTRLLPTAWQAPFVFRYNQMIRDLSAHLRKIGAYKALRIVKLDGLNEETQELGIGATRPADFSCPLDNSRDLSSGWAEMGFTPNKLLWAWKQIARNVAGAFPDKLLSVDILGSQEGFPSLDNSSQQVSPPAGATDATTASLLDWTLLPGPDQPKFSNRFSVQWDALSTGGVDPEVLRAGTLGAKIAWQTNDRLSALGSGCLGPSGTFVACEDSAQYQAMLDYGIQLKGQFIEVAPVDVIMYPDAFYEPHQALLAATN